MLSNKRVIGLMLAVVVVTVLATVVALNESMGSLLVGDTSFPSMGTIKAVGVGVYWDEKCSDRASVVNWSSMEPSSVKNITAFVRNEGKEPVTLSLQTANWSPANATDYMTLSWSYANQTLSPDQVVGVAFSLSILPDIQGITSFNFDIVISAVG